jgi:hypothetical protein
MEENATECDTYLIDESDDKIYREHYDAKMSNITLNECGTECTIGENCGGFGYKPITKECYLSKRGILGAPQDSIYEDEYNKLDKRCNKINRITDEDRLDEITLTRNSVYVCSDGENNSVTSMQFANLGSSSLDGPLTTPFDRSDSDVIPSTQIAYKTLRIEWPTTKVNLQPKYDINIDKQHIQSINDIENEDYKMKNNKKKKKNMFVESDREYLGQYSLAHQCVVNVPLYDCIKFCDDDDDCAGAEWNKTILKTDGKQNYMYENVCCPKRVISQIIPRRQQFNRGKFYVKKEIGDNNNVSDDRIIITKEFNSNTESNTITRKTLMMNESNAPPPMNDKFKLKYTTFKKLDFNDPKDQHFPFTNVEPNPQIS